MGRSRNETCRCQLRQELFLARFEPRVEKKLLESQENIFFLSFFLSLKDEEEEKHGDLEMKASEKFERWRLKSKNYSLKDSERDLVVKIF